MPDDKDNAFSELLEEQRIGKEITPIKKKALHEAKQPRKKPTRKQPAPENHQASQNTNKHQANEYTKKPTPQRGSATGTESNQIYCMGSISKPQFKRWEKTAKKQNHQELDLHGKYQKEAEQEIHKYITRLCHSNIDTGYIIHGKGSRSRNQQAVLRPLVRSILQQHPQVKGYSTTAAGGATIVWLKT